MANYSLEFPGDWTNFGYPKGWQKLVNKLIKDLDNITEEYTILQIKEKFGGLRFYASLSIQGLPEDYSKQWWNLIDKAEQESYTICQECGAPGKLRDSHGWMYTSCEEHNYSEENCITETSEGFITETCLEPRS